MFSNQYFFCLRQIGQILATTCEAKLNLFLAAQDKKLPGHKPFCPLRVKSFEGNRGWGNRLKNYPIIETKCFDSNLLSKIPSI